MVEVKKTSTQITVKSPYNNEFVEKARLLGGRWNDQNKTWVFDIRDEERVKNLLMEVYGDDGFKKDTCTVRVIFREREIATRKPITVFGRVVARAFGRDSRAVLGDGVVLLEAEMGYRPLGVRGKPRPEGNLPLGTRGRGEAEV